MGRLGDEILSRLNAIIGERKALGGPSQRRLASLIGCSSAHMTHLLTGRSPLTLEWLEKICAALKIDPAGLFEREGGPVARSAYDVYEKPHAGIHERFQSLLEQGLEAEMAAWVEFAEGLLKRCQAHLEGLIRSCGAEAGVLWRRTESGLLPLSSSLPPTQLRRLQDDPGIQGWRKHGSGRFEVWLKNPRAANSEAQSALFLEMFGDLVEVRLLHQAGRIPP